MIRMILWCHCSKIFKRPEIFYELLARENEQIDEFVLAVKRIRSYSFVVIGFNEIQ